jgi:negative regulator of flagellin synthesis FlgM
MQINGITHLHGAQPINGPHRTQPAQAAEASDGWMGIDEVDISHEADMVSRARELPDIRADRVAEIRAQIASGAYETDEKLDHAVGRLLDEISG